VLERVAGYTLAAIGACALMIATADAAGLVHAAEIKPRPGAQKQNKHGALTAARSSNKRSLLKDAARRNGGSSGQTRKQPTSTTGAAHSARWRTGRRRLCGKRCR
jgi:hypothetical protein